MINKINKISNILKNAHINYNASLPVLIKVISKLKGDMYLLQIGAKNIQTKSVRTLNIGEKYWGEMGRSSLGHITLTNLVAQPKIMDFFNDAPLKFSLQNLMELSSNDEDIFEGFRDFLIQKLAQSASKEEFIFLGNILLGLKNGILSLVISEKNEVLQIKKIATNKVRFSAIMPTLAIVEGEIGIYNDERTLDIKVLYESTKAILEKHLSHLKGFKVGKISVEKHLSPLYECKEALLDVRG